MAKTFYYQNTHSMEARPGTNYATTYYKQTLEQRKQLSKHIFRCSREVVEALDRDPDLMQWATTHPLKGFPKTAKQPNRTVWEILEDIVGESKGVKKNGDPKDYAAAPIERWNKLFAGTEYEFRMEQNAGTKKTTFESLWEVA
ncbi:hypothetical protein UFOVP389_19 [uncultured Caudovirales phage]|uniref:Uncharacterized protein n=1 Tax=uncultured Caudovirales phage TaxID=2100421 RepID=A0A6J7X0B6_9CAUD|nr:hypothetical protein UFOVP389_19 [uncultured Caudovirales phage]